MAGPARRPTGLRRANGPLQSGLLHAEALLEARLGTLVVSVDPAHIQAYERARVVEDLDRVLDNLRGLRALARQQGLVAPRIGLEFVVTRRNLGDLARLPDLARALGASFAEMTSYWKS